MPSMGTEPNAPLRVSGSSPRPETGETSPAEPAVTVDSKEQAQNCWILTKLWGNYWDHGSQIAVYFFDCSDVTSCFKPLIYNASHIAMIMSAMAGLFTSRNADNSCFVSARCRFLVLEDSTQLIGPVFFPLLSVTVASPVAAEMSWVSQVQGFVANPTYRHSVQHVDACDYILAPCALSTGENPRRFLNFASCT